MGLNGTGRTMHLRSKWREAKMQIDGAFKLTLRRVDSEPDIDADVLSMFPLAAPQILLLLHSSQII